MRHQALVLKNDEIFEAVFSKFGGRLDTTTWPPLTKLMNGYLMRVREKVNDTQKNILPNMPNIYVDYFSYQQVQAGATEVSNRGIIGIAGGAAGVLFLVFRRMLADRRIMLHIGDINFEATNLPDLVGKPENLFNLAADLGSWADPQDDKRAAAATHLIQTAFDFLLAHEYAHIKLNHCLFCLDQTVNSLMVEVVCQKSTDNKKSKGIDELTSQALEIGADADATNQELGEMLWRIEHPETVLGPFQFLYNDPSEAIYLWFFSIFTFFRLLGSAKINLEDLGKGDHPHFRIRQRGIIAHACDFFEHECPRLYESIPSIAQRALIDAETAYAQITGKKADFTELKLAFEDSRAMEHIRRVLKRGREIEPELVILAPHRMRSA